MSVILETSIGDVTIDLFTEERPRCCLNFLKLCKIKYYNFSLFHSVQENLVAQVGDPTATGRGGESIFGHLYGEQARYFDQEAVPRLKHERRGLVSMVNNGSGMHGSQFFLTLADGLDYLDGKHTVFGEVAEGWEVVDKLNKTFVDDGFRPHQDIRIYHTVVLDDPYDDPSGLEPPAKSPGPTQEMLDSDRIPCDADIHEDDGKTAEELAEMEAEKEAKANTQILEMVGDLPSADAAPDENVLFVCKLNPVTTSDDLEIIFSRFGNIKSCDVIKDQKTGESLQYAFIEFSTSEECEKAYFKMDNVLIDDRRIHVDFSQSVAKYKWKGKGQGVEIQTGGSTQLVLKNQQRVDNRYDLVYEHDEGSTKSLKNSKVTSNDKSSKPEGSREKSKDNHRSKHKEKIEEDGRSTSYRKRQQSLSPSPEPKYKANRRDNKDRDRQQYERDRDRDGSNRDRDRDRSDRDRDRDRGERDRGRDRSDIDREDRRERNRDHRERFERQSDNDRYRQREDRRRDERNDRDRSRSEKDTVRDMHDKDRHKNERYREERERFKDQSNERGRKKGYSESSEDEKFRKRKTTRDTSSEPEKSKKSKKKKNSSRDDSEERSKRKDKKGKTKSKKKRKSPSPESSSESDTDSSDSDSSNSSDSEVDKRKRKKKKAAKSSKRQTRDQSVSSDDSYTRVKKKKKKSKR